MQCKVKYGLVWRKAEKRCKFVFVITSKIVHEENDVWALKFEIFILSLILWEISLRYDKKSVFSEICGFRLFYWMSPPDNIGPYGWVIKSGRQLFPHLPFSDLSHFSNIPAMPVSEPQVKLHNQDIAKMQTYPDCFSLEEYQSSCNSSQFTSGAKFSDWNLWRLWWPNFQ